MSSYRYVLFTLTRRQQLNLNLKLSKKTCELCPVGSLHQLRSQRHSHHLVHNRRHFWLRNSNQNHPSSSSTRTSTSITDPKETVQKIPKTARNKPFYQRPLFAITALTTTCAIVVYYKAIETRKWRDEHLNTVPLASTSGYFFLSSNPNQLHDDYSLYPKNNNNNNNNKNSNSYSIPSNSRRCVRILANTIERTSLMGKSIPGAKSVKQELNVIRKWHQERGYTGGIVLRELTQPLFLFQGDSSISSNNSNTNSSSNSNHSPTTTGGDDVENIPIESLPHRECYYLYYEIKPNGQTLQQIFCRGTTLLADVYTCLQSHYHYDSELECNIHAGFLSHANRLLDDVEPLLQSSKYNPRSIVEVCGHSLGGAVAMIVAMKLKRRGYNVRRVTAIAAPRFVDEKSINLEYIHKHLLPYDSLRIEDDLDGVPWLPPRGSSLGHKLWLCSDDRGTHTNKFAMSDQLVKSENDTLGENGDGDSSSSQSLTWIDSSWINCRLLETLQVINTTHRLPSYVKRVNELKAEIEQSSTTTNS